MHSIRTAVSALALLSTTLTLNVVDAEAQSFRELIKQSDQAQQVKTDALKGQIDNIVAKCKAEGQADLGACIEKQINAGSMGVSIARRAKSANMGFASGLWNATPRSANACSNGDFSNGQAGWSGYRLKRTQGGGLPLQNYLNAESPFASSACNQSYGQTCLNIETGGTDPYVPVNQTYAGNSLVMGGDNNAGYMSEGIARKFVKTSATDTYPFKYAFSMQHSHGAQDSAFFAAIAMDSSGNVIDIISDSADASNPFVQTTGNHYYRDWHCEKLDLSPVPDGQEVLVFFVNSDCAQGGHSGHTYIDEICEDCGTDDPEGGVEIDAETDDCLDEDESQTINGSFSVPSGATNVAVNLKVYQNGSLVTTLTGASISGGNYTKTVVRSDFPSLDCFDIDAELTFDYGGSTITKNSDGANGFKAGQNNDICLNCTPPPPCADCDTCCPPWSQGQMQDMFSFAQDGTGYRVDYTSNASIDGQMNAWLNYAQAMDPGVEAINVLFYPTECTTNQSVTDTSTCSPTSFFDIDTASPGYDYNLLEWDGVGSSDKKKVGPSYAYPADWSGTSQILSRSFEHNRLYTINAFPFVRRTDGTYDFLDFDCPISKMKLNFQIQFGRMASGSKPSTRYGTTTLRELKSSQQGRQILEQLNKLENATASTGGTSTGKVEWTGWQNLDRPGGNGDYQTLKGMRDRGIGCDKPVDIQCRQSGNKTDWKAGGETVTCNVQDGGYCVNKLQKDGRCEDYEVRLLCPK